MVQGQVFKIIEFGVGGLSQCSLKYTGISPVISVNKLPLFHENNYFKNNLHRDGVSVKLQKEVNQARFILADTMRVFITLKRLIQVSSQKFGTAASKRNKLFKLKRTFCVAAISLVTSECVSLLLLQEQLFSCYLSLHASGLIWSDPISSPGKGKWWREML